MITSMMLFNLISLDFYLPKEVSEYIECAQKKPPERAACRVSRGWKLFGYTKLVDTGLGVGFSGGEFS